MTRARRNGFQHLLDGWIADTEGSISSVTNMALDKGGEQLILSVERGLARTIRSLSTPAPSYSNASAVLAHWLARFYAAGRNPRRPSIKRLVIRSKEIWVACDAVILPAKVGTGTLGVFSLDAILPAKEVIAHDEIDFVIMSHLAWGASFKEIAIKVSLSARTVEHRLERLKARSGCRTTMELIAAFASSRVGGEAS